MEQLQGVISKEQIVREMAIAREINERTSKYGASQSESAKTIIAALTWLGHAMGLDQNEWSLKVIASGGGNPYFEPERLGARCCPEFQLDGTTIGVEISIRPSKTQNDPRIQGTWWVIELPSSAGKIEVNSRERATVGAFCAAASKYIYEEAIRVAKNGR